MIEIQEYTTKNPISLIGKEAGICWDANITDPEKNYNRGLNCLNSQHGRTFEFPSVYMIIEGYSARVIREFYTHIGGLPTRLQSSTRYIEYGNFEYIIPPNIESSPQAKKIYIKSIEQIQNSIGLLERIYNIPREDTANLLPLGMTTKIVCKMNLRTLIDMSHQRKCTRAYWEFRKLFKELENELRNYSEEWRYIVDIYFKPKCEYLSYCPEKYSCGKIDKK